MFDLKRNWLLPTLLFCAVAIVAAYSCGREVGQANQGATPEVSANRSFAMNVVVSGVPFWGDTRSTWVNLGDSRGDVSTSFGGPLDTDEQKQIEEIEALIASGIDGLVIAPTNSASLAPTIDKLVDSGTPVITYLVDAPGSKRLIYIASELERASQRVADYTVVDSGEGMKAAILFAEAGNAEQEARRRGFEQFADASEGLEIVAVLEDKYDEALGAELVRATLAKHPDLSYIFGCNSRSAVGAVAALREMGIEKGSVTVTGWDTDEDVLGLISDGWVKTSAAQHSAFMTNLAFALLDSHSRRTLFPQNRQFEENDISPAPDNLIVPIQLVTGENVNGFYAN